MADRAAGARPAARAGEEEASEAGRAISTALRVVRINLMAIEPDDKAVDGLLDGVLAELEAAARNILRNDSGERGSALWFLANGR